MPFKAAYSIRKKQQTHSHKTNLIPESVALRLFIMQQQQVVVPDSSVTMWWKKSKPKYTKVVKVRGGGGLESINIQLKIVYYIFWHNEVSVIYALM